jgi:DNA-binding NarL/FixJ family response regulator
MIESFSEKQLAAGVLYRGISSYGYGMRASLTGRRGMSLIRNVDPIRVGVLTDEPLRLEGLASIFEHIPGEGCAQLIPVVGKIDELLSDSTLEYMVVDLNSSSGSLRTLDDIRLKRPKMRLIVIGPENDDKLVLDSIMAGARAYLDLKARPGIVHQAVEAVTSGLIWAPRRLLSTLIDQLLEVSDASLTNQPPRLTERERQVLDLILQAYSNREIARELGIEESTVQAHVGRLMRKTGTENRLDLLIRASDPALMKAAGFIDRRPDDRRSRDRHRVPALGPRSEDHE